MKFYSTNSACSSKLPVLAITCEQQFQLLCYGSTLEIASCNLAHLIYSLSLLELVQSYPYDDYS